MSNQKLDKSLDTIIDEKKAKPAEKKGCVRARGAGAVGRMAASPPQARRRPAAHA